MLLFSILAAAIAPGISLLTYLYLRDKYEAEPIHIVVRMFVLGVLVVVPIMVVQRGLEIWLGNGTFVASFIHSAAVEEFLKWFILYHVIYNHTEFDEPYDGILYAASISLGFATLENVLYAIYTPSSFGSLLARAMLPVSGHALFGVMMGYYLGKAKFAGTRKKMKLFLSISFALPFLLHGFYDLILMSVEQNWIWVIVPFMIGLWAWGLHKMNSANAKSPFRLVTREEEVKS
ncbi:PrsW family intramembrane metalloprotease [Paenibacillus sp. MY03]|jgi:RsiW-degrading membrane proteinase PrsW (M82 family)|uniref:Protease PrsW n=1 Tax=Paenibacillus agaridevorans TaxID=171404 RepID=A0A2R5EZG9_9BACL|nr:MULTISPECIES: glutamic-type intramembrane protease PrsW [Paenibacillus]OUS77397.1 PrsW family intramembrane metalloprotease [Paenibacillus sp. MY03]GBG12060.1 PrsW family intramembrane metalloprotease [Paenibacillus agaridevorans]